MKGQTNGESVMASYDGKTGVGGGAVVDLLHEGTVLRESESEIIDQLEATVRSDKDCEPDLPSTKLFTQDKQSRGRSRHIYEGLIFCTCEGFMKDIL